MSIWQNIDWLNRPLFWLFTTMSHWVHAANAGLKSNNDFRFRSNPSNLHQSRTTPSRGWKEPRNLFLGSLNVYKHGLCTTSLTIRRSIHASLNMRKKYEWKEPTRNRREWQTGRDWKNIRGGGKTISVVFKYLSNQMPEPIFLYGLWGWNWFLELSRSQVWNRVGHVP
jgi:hypothetical protein